MRRSRRRACLKPNWRPTWFGGWCRWRNMSDSDPEPKPALPASAEQHAPASRLAPSAHDPQEARKAAPSVWRAVAMVGAIGWAVAVPMLIGVAVGTWIDHRVAQPLLVDVDVVIRRPGARLPGCVDQNQTRTGGPLMPGPLRIVSAFAGGPRPGFALLWRIVADGAGSAQVAPSHRALACQFLGAKRAGIAGLILAMDGTLAESGGLHGRLRCWRALCWSMDSRTRPARERAVV